MLRRRSVYAQLLVKIKDETATEKRYSESKSNQREMPTILEKRGFTTETRSKVILFTKELIPYPFRFLNNLNYKILVSQWSSRTIWHLRICAAAHVITPERKKYIYCIMQLVVHDYCTYLIIIKKTTFNNDDILKGVMFISKR